MSSTKDTSKKKPYHSPRLKIYGTVEELTQTSSVNGKEFDYASGGFETKTG